MEDRGWRNTSADQVLILIIMEDTHGEITNLLVSS